MTTPPLDTPAEAIDPTSPAPQVLVKELARILHNALLFTHKDNLIPAIASVALESTGTHLVATGTDRFLLGASATPYADEKWTVVLPRDHVATLLAVLKTVRSTWISAYLSRSPQGRRFRVEIPLEELKFSFPTGVRDDTNFKYPAWRHLIKDHKVSKDSPSVISVDAAKLAVFAKVKVTPYTDNTMRIGLVGSHRPVQIRIGEEFAGLIMPRRLPDEATNTEEPTWL